MSVKDASGLDIAEISEFCDEQLIVGIGTNLLDVNIQDLQRIVHSHMNPVLAEAIARAAGEDGTKLARFSSAQS